MHVSLLFLGSYTKGNMLHESQDGECAERVQFWNSQAGLAAFHQLVSSLVTPPPDVHDPEMHKVLRAAVPRTLVASYGDTERRVADAAREVSQRLKTTRAMIARYYDFCNEPVRPRHGTYVGPSDRREEADAPELAPHLPRNPHFAKWLAASK